MLEFPRGLGAAPFLMCFSLACVIGAPAAAADAPYVTGAYLREAPPGQTVVAGFFELHNPTSEPLTLVGAECPAARSIEIHTHDKAGGVMRMRRLPDLRIAPHSTTRFQTGGLHLMVFGLEPAPHAGDEVDIDLVFADGARITVPFAVRSIFEEVQ